VFCVHELLNGPDPGLEDVTLRALHAGLGTTTVQMQLCKLQFWWSVWTAGPATMDHPRTMFAHPSPVFKWKEEEKRMTVMMNK
jgi:hypothetical protein